MNYREEKIENKIRELAATFIEHERGNTSLITVTRVMLDQKRRNATIFISVMPRNKENAAFGFIKRNPWRFDSSPEHTTKYISANSCFGR